MGELIEAIVGNYRYTLSRELKDMDRLVLKFARILNDMSLHYAFISGYVSILFGRSRLSEDIDIIVEKMEFAEFKKLWDALRGDFWCIITDSVEDAYYDYLLSNTAIRFALRDSVIPNIEMKFPKTELERWVLENTIDVTVGHEKLKISDIELQIAFKLYLGSEKDIEDAKHLYEFFKEGIDKDKLEKFVMELHVAELARRYL